MDNGLKKAVLEANMALKKLGLVIFTWGDTPDDAVHNTVVLEVIATMAFHSRLINPELGAMPQELLDRHFLRKHGDGAYYGQA
jgi:L-ribulose-5-phosphate 4-epimerase